MSVIDVKAGGGASFGRGAFRLYFDEGRTRPTPYDEGGSYFRFAKDRMERTFKLIERHVPGKRVLDIGASPFYLLYLARAHGAADCHGTYYANDGHPLRECESVHSDRGAIGIHHSDIENDPLPFPDASFDIVTACEVLEHLEHFPKLFASEARRVLKPGGLLCITVPNVCRVANIAKLLLQKNIYMKYRPDPTGRHKHEFTTEELRALVDFMGMELVSTGAIGYSTSPRGFMKPINRAFGSVPGLRRYAPVIYVIARQPAGNAAKPLGAPPELLFTDARSIED